jgi:tetratricopeptide (TPR) repeat protein
MAFTIAEALTVFLTPEEQQEVRQRRTHNPEAYELGLRANGYVSRNTRQDYVKAISLYEQAIKLDPDFAWAYASLAMTYLMVYYTYDRNPVWLQKAEPAVERALELNPTDAASHYSQALLHLRLDRTEEAVAEARKATELAPNDAMAFFQLGFVYDAIHDYRHAAEAYEQSLALVPFELDTYYNLILDFDLLHDYERRRQASERGIPYYERYLSRNPDDQNKRQRYASMLYFVGRKEECFREIEALLALGSLDAKTYFNCACRYAVDGQIEKAFEVLFKALEAGYMDFNQLMTDPDLAALRPTDQWHWLSSHVEQRIQSLKTASTS